MTWNGWRACPDRNSPCNSGWAAAVARASCPSKDAFPHDPPFPFRRRGAARAGRATLCRSGGRSQRQLRILPAQDGEDGGTALVGD
ncbi:hypothetical protein [Sphingobium cloacae]|uniref:hypothetical protein n=1 Tax=Sphingobium cloacae TaxID=120107 RepID=UPI00389A4624